ncbi:hypothetical protein M0805_006903 [Coniferiporia weirii]|nr:hypothetical protein M0805_006903 [Coniferiporia weirii]
MALAPRPVPASLRAPDSSSPTPAPASDHPEPKTFRRFRTSLGHTIRAAAAAGTRSRNNKPPLAQPQDSQQPADAHPRPLGHKHSISDTSAALVQAPPLLRESAKHRASVDFVVAVPADKDGDRDRSRFGPLGGLRKFDSRVSLRKLTGRDSARSPDPRLSSASNTSESNASAASAQASQSALPPPSPAPAPPPLPPKSKLRKDREREPHGPGAEATPSATSASPPPRTQSKSAWSVLVPTLSHASSSGPTHSSGQAAPPADSKARVEGERRRSVESARRGSMSAAAGASASATGPQRVRTRDRDYSREPDRVALPSAALAPDAAPSSSSPARSRPKLTSPSSPSLASPVLSSSSPSPPSSPTRSRSRPVPPPSAHVPAAAAAPSPSPSPTSPSTPLTRSGATPTPSPTPTASPMPGSPVKSRTSVSRPPLSPSANANSRLRLRLAGTSSATHLPLDLSSSSSGLSSSERRRTSVGSVAPGTSGRTTPTQNAQGRTTPTSPTAPSRPARADRTKEREREQQHTRSRASASTSSLVDRSRSPSQTRGIRRATSPTPAPARTSPSPVQTLTQSQPSLPPAYRDTIRHASALLLRELHGPRPRANTASPPSSPIQATFSAGASSSTQGWTPDVWDECEQRLRLLARAERVRGPYGASSASLASPSNSSVNNLANSVSSSSGEERERRMFAEAVKDGYVLCQLMNKLRPGTISRVDPYEDGFRTSSNATKFLAAASGALSVPMAELFQRDDLIRCTPDGLFRVARTIVAVVARAGEDAAELAARRILLGGQGKTRTSAAGTNSPYGTRAKAASASTPNLSTLQRAVSPPLSRGQPPSSPPPSPTKTRTKAPRRWSPPSPTLSTVPAGDSRSGTGSGSGANSKAGSASGAGGNGRDAAASSASSGHTTQAAKVSPSLTAKSLGSSAAPLAPSRLKDESALVTDSEDSDANELFHSVDSAREKAPVLLTSSTVTRAPQQDGQELSKPPAMPVRASVSSETTHTTAQSSLLAASRPNWSIAATGGTDTGDRTSANFGTTRMTTTVATSLAPSDLQSLYHRADTNSFVGSASEASHWDELSSGSQHSGYVHSSVLKKAPVLRDRRPSEAAFIDLSRVAEEGEEGVVSSRDGGEVDEDAETRRRPQAIQLGKGKWPDDFVTAFKPTSPTRPIAFHRAEAERTLSSNPLSSSPLSSSSPRKFAYVGMPAQADASTESLSQSPPPLAPRRALNRPRHSLDAPALLPKEIAFPREHTPSPSADGGAPSSNSGSRVVLRRNSSANRSGVYVPRSDSASPVPAPETGGARVPFPRAVSGEHPGILDASTAATSAAGSMAQQNRLARGRFQSDVDAGTRRRPRPNSYDELGAKPHRSRIESMVSLGGASSSNFSASDIRSSMDGSAVRKTLIIRDEGKPGTHFQLGNCIGRGQFGSVYRALNLNTGQMVAVKRIRLEGLSEDDVKQLMREVDVVKSLSHPSIVKYEGMSRDSDTLNIVLEFAENGSLGQTLKAFGKLNEKLVATYVIKILEGLDYLHRNDVVHCDLKAANILTTKNGNVKLSDFGVSLNLRKVGRDHKSDVTGTPNWMAPEVIELKGASRASDIWSLGCTVIELLTGRPPYADIQNGMSVMYRIVDDPMPPIPDEWSSLLKDFLKQCFQRDPADRPSAEVLCDHDWLKEHCEIHKVLRPKDSIPFLRRVSTDLQKSDVVRFLGVNDAPRSDSRASSELPRRSEDRSPSPATSGLPGSPPKKRLSAGPASPKKSDSEIYVVSEHSFVETSFGKPLLCRVCMQSVRKSAVTCGECGLIAHSRCAPDAPPTCGLRAQLLQYASYPPTPESPNALEIFRQITPSGSPIPDSAFPSQTGTPSPGVDMVPTPPTAFKMFNAFRRSRSSLSPEPHPLRTGSRASQEGSNESHAGPSTNPPRRPSVLLKPDRMRPRPISTSSDGTTPNRSSLRSAYTGGSVDLSDESYPQSHAHSPSRSQQSHPNSRGQSAQAIARSRSRGRAGASSGMSVSVDEADAGVETETEAEAGTRYAPSRFSIAASAADSADPRRASVLAASNVGDAYDEDLEEEHDREHERTFSRMARRRSRRHESKASGDKDKGCVLQ